MTLKNDMGKKAKFTFYQILGIGIGFLSMLLFLSVKLYSKLFLLLDSFTGKIDSICGCAEYLSFTNHPIVSASLILLGLAITAFFGFAVAKIIKLKWLTNKFVENNLKNKKLQISRRLKKISAVAGIKNQIIELKDKKPIIFCFGLLSPKICVSSGFIKRLSGKELKAVLLHEQRHLFNNEPIKIFIIKSITKILFFLPGLKLFSEQYLIFSELAADQWATDDFKNKAPLAGALYKVIKLKKQMIIKNELALSFFASQIIEERVNKLTDSGHKTKFKIFTSKLNIGIVLLLISFFIINQAISPDSLAADGNNISNCSRIKPDFSQQKCDMLITDEDAL